MLLVLPLACLAAVKGAKEDPAAAHVPVFGIDERVPSLDIASNLPSPSLEVLQEVLQTLRGLDALHPGTQQRVELVDLVAHEFRRLQETASTAPSALPVTTESFQVPGAEATSPEGEEVESGEEGESAEEKEEEFSPEGVGVAFTLLGSLAFGMILLYLVNWIDDDIRRYSWLVISMTISIFCAVLIFAGTREWLESLFLSQHAALQVLIFDYGLFLCWFIALHVVTAVSAGLFGGGVSPFELDQDHWVVEDSLRSSHQEEVPPGSIATKQWGLGICMGSDGYPVFARKRKLLREKLDRRLRCWATIMAHTTGFASISAGVALQHYGWFGSNAATTLVASLAHMAILVLLFSIESAIFTCHGRPEALVDMYDEQMVEAFNDVASLTLSFLVVQSIKYSCTGVQGDFAGFQPASSIPTGWTGSAGLFAIGLIFLALGIACVACLRENAADSKLRRRAKDVFQTSCTMCFSYCVLFSARWAAIALYKNGIISLKPGSMLINVALSVSLSGVAFLGTWILDKIEDRLEEQRERQAIIFRSTITALGLLVGLSWEHSFDVAVEVAASKTDEPVSMELALTVAVVVLIVPAWRRHILGKQIYYEQLKESMKTRSFMTSDQDQTYLINNKAFS